MQADNAAPTVSPSLADPEVADDAIRGWAKDDADLARLLQSGLTTAHAAARWGLALFKGNRAADAVAVFRAAVSLEPRDPDKWTNFGIALAKTNSPGEAAGALERSVRLSRPQPDVWMLLGMEREKLGDLVGAEAAYRVVLDLNPAAAAAWQCLGALKEQKRDYLGAIECFRTGMAMGQGSAALWANLGRLYYRTGFVREACDAYEASVRHDSANENYRAMLAKVRFLRAVVDRVPVDDALLAYEAAAPFAHGQEVTGRLQLLDGGAGLLGSAGHAEAAVRLSSKRLELLPESASARYLHHALSGEPGVDRSPTAYIVESFDAFAEQFDAKLVGVLGYDVPEQIVAALEHLKRPSPFEDVLDAGCGTGLCGPLLRPMATNLTGVDLSPRMLERAALLRVYDTLVCDELTVFLARRRQSFDLVVATDVVIYFGDLAELFMLAAASLRPGGIFALSTERLGADGYALLPSGRFAHSVGYVRSVANSWFQEDHSVEATLRFDVNERVPGDLFLFRRL